MSLFEPDQPKDKNAIPKGPELHGSDAVPNTPAHLPAIPRSIISPLNKTGIVTLVPYYDEARVALMLYMQKTAPEKWCQQNPGCQYGQLLNLDGVRKKAALFPALVQATLMLNYLLEAGQDLSDSEGYFFSIKETLAKIRRSFPGLSTTVMAVGCLPDGQQAYFLAFHRTDYKELIIPCNTPHGYNFKEIAVSSKDGLIGLIIRTDEKIIDDDVDTFITDHLPYISPKNAEIELVALSKGQIGRLISDMLLKQYNWGFEIPNKFDVINARELPDGNVEAYISLYDSSSIEDDSDAFAASASQDTLDALGIMRIVIGFAKNGLFQILDSQYFPNDEERSLFRAGLAEDPDLIPESEDGNPAENVLPKAECISPGANLNPINMRSIAISAIDGLRYQFNRLGYQSISSIDELRHSPQGVRAVALAQNYILKLFNRKSPTKDGVVTVFKKVVEEVEEGVGIQSLEYVVAVNATVLADPDRFNPQPNFFMVQISLGDLANINDTSPVEIRLIGVQTDKDKFAEELRVLVEGGADLSLGLATFLVATLPDEVKARQFEHNDDIEPLRFSLGIQCPLNTNSDITRIPLTIFDPNSREIYLRTLCWDPNTGIIPLGGFFSWRGIVGGGCLSRGNASYWEGEDLAE